MKKFLLILSFIGFQATTTAQGYDFSGKMKAFADGLCLENSETQYSNIKTFGNIVCGFVAGAIQPFCGFHGVEDEDGASYMLNGTPKAFNYAVGAGLLSWIPGIAIALHVSGVLKD